MNVKLVVLNYFFPDFFIPPPTRGPTKICKENLL